MFLLGITESGKMKVLVELELSVDEEANFLSSTTDYHLEDIKELVELVLGEVDDITIERLYLEELE